MSEPEVQDQTDLADEIAPSIPFEEAAHADNSSNEDEVLDRLLGVDEPQKAEAVPTPEPSAPDPDVDRALKALQRDGVPKDVIESIKNDPSKLKEWGLKAAKRQADVDAFGAKVAESKKDPKAESKETVKASAKSEDGEADVDPLSQFGDIFGDEAAKPLRDLTDRMRSEFDDRARVLEVKYETQLAYERISRDYGRNAPSYEEISEKAAQIGRENPGAFSSVSDIVRQAFRVTAGEPKKVDPRNAARPNVGANPSRPTRQVDAEDLVLDVLLSGGSRADAQRILSR